MFPHGYFPNTYFIGQYFPPVVLDAGVTGVYPGPQPAESVFRKLRKKTKKEHQKDLDVISVWLMMEEIMDED